MNYVLVVKTRRHLNRSPLSIRSTSQLFCKIHNNGFNDQTVHPMLPSRSWESKLKVSCGARNYFVTSSFCLFFCMSLSAEGAQRVRCIPIPICTNFNVPVLHVGTKDLQTSLSQCRLQILLTYLVYVFALPNPFPNTSLNPMCEVPVSGLCEVEPAPMHS